MKFTPVIGLEVHIQLKTKSKMFCSCPNAEAKEPNTNICPICLGHPGALPVPNKAAIEMGIKMSTALNCKINTHPKFDRKNYFYPDLPKGYQISQFDLPVGENGSIDIEVPNKDNGRDSLTIGIERLHLEEDAAKNIHSKDGNKSFVDYNRGGVPLIELVSKPELRTPAEAKAYLQEVRLIARMLGISDADMEKGHLRCDANISLRRVEDDGTLIDVELNPKTEIKNLNSFRMVERAISHEIERQTALWENNKPPMETTTRGWDDNKGITVKQRTKEGLADYRFFPDPDLPRMDLTEISESAAKHHPELPKDKRARFMDEYGLNEEEARQVIDSAELANFTEQMFSELLAWIHASLEYKNLSEEERVAEVKRMSKIAGTWLIQKWTGVLKNHKFSISDKKVTPENFAELVKLLMQEQLTNKTALKVLEIMTVHGKDPSHVMEDEGFGRMHDEGELANIVVSVIDSHKAEVDRYLAGEDKLIKFLIGMIMKQTEGRADPGVIQNMLSVELEVKRK